MAKGFDADAWEEAQQPWVFSSGGQSWPARPIGSQEVTRAATQLAAADPLEALRITRRLLRLAFPWRFSMRWRGDPVALIMALPAAALKELLESFFVWAGLRSETKTNPTTLPSTPFSPPRPSPMPPREAETATPG